MEAVRSVGLALLWVFWLAAGVGADAGEPEASYGRGLDLGGQGNFIEAREALEQALAAEPFDATASCCLETVQDVLRGKIKPQTGMHLLRAMARGGGGDWQSYLVEVGRALELDPGYAQAYNHRGNAYIELGQLEEALGDYDQALKLNPRSAGTLNNRGIALRRLGQLDRALADYNRALEINPALALAYYNRALVYRQKGKLELAIMDLDRALTLNPRYLEARFNKAMVCEGAGHRREAAEAYKEFLQVARPDYESHIQYARERLRVLEEERSQGFRQAGVQGVNPSR